MEVETPHFGYPFTLATDAAVVEQDSLDEIADCITRIANTEKGERDDLPDFGVTYPLFQQVPVDMDTLVTELRTWEPRADLSGAQRVDSVDELITVIRLDVRPDDRGEE